MTQTQDEARQAPRVTHQFMVRYRPVTAERVAWQVAPLQMIALGVTFDESNPSVTRLINDAVAHFLRRRTED